MNPLAIAVAIGMLARLGEAKPPKDERGGGCLGIVIISFLSLAAGIAIAKML